MRRSHAALIFVCDPRHIGLSIDAYGSCLRYFIRHTQGEMFTTGFFEPSSGSLSLRSFHPK